jgi:hypothetical protein
MCVTHGAMKSVHEILLQQYQRIRPLWRRSHTWRIILKWSLPKYWVRTWTQLPGSGHSPTATYCGCQSECTSTQYEPSVDRASPFKWRTVPSDCCCSGGSSSFILCICLYLARLILSRPQAHLEHKTHTLKMVAFCVSAPCSLVDFCCVSEWRSP